MHSKLARGSLAGLRTQLKDPEGPEFPAPITVLLDARRRPQIAAEWARSHLLNAECCFAVEQSALEASSMVYAAPSLAAPTYPVRLSDRSRRLSSSVTIHALLRQSPATSHLIMFLHGHSASYTRTLLVFVLLYTIPILHSSTTAQIPKEALKQTCLLRLCRVSFGTRPIPSATQCGL